MRTIDDYPALKCFMTGAELDTVLQGLRVLLFELKFTHEEIRASFNYETTSFSVDVSGGHYMDMGSYFIWIGGHRLQYYSDKWREKISRWSKPSWHAITLEELKQKL